MPRNQIRLEIQRREPFAGGVSFGNTGAYERLFGNAHFAIDPGESGLPSIVDLDLAPRNAAGLVEFSATLDIIKPVEIAREPGLEFGVHRQGRGTDEVAQVREDRLERLRPDVVGPAAAEGEPGRRRRERLEAEPVEIDGAAHVPRVGEHEAAGLVQRTKGLDRAHDGHGW